MLRSKRGKKKYEKFGLGCPDYPRCSGCEFFERCEDCGDLFCIWEGGTCGTDELDGVLCGECFGRWKAILGIEEKK